MSQFPASPSEKMGGTGEIRRDQPGGKRSQGEETKKEEVEKTPLQKLEEKAMKGQQVIDQLTKKLQVAQKEKAKLEEKVAELENIIKIKERDQMEAKKSIEDQSFNPIFFTSTKTRDEFWRMMEEYSQLIEKKSKFDEMHESVTSELKTKIHGLQMEVEHKNKLLQDKELIEYNNRLVSMDHQTAIDQLRGEQAKMKEIALKLTTLETRLTFTEKERDEAVRSLMEVTQLFNERLAEAENEKTKLFETIKKLRDSKLAPSDMDRMNFADMGMFGMKNKKEGLDQIFIRLKTTSNASDKFAEIMDILGTMLATSRKEEADIGGDTTKSSLNKRILEQMRDPANYRFYLKALHSRNHKVIVSTTKFLLDLGDINQRAQEYMDLGASSALVKILRVSADESMKHCAVTFLSKLADSTPEICKEIQQLGAIPKLIEEVKGNSKGTSLISNYLKDLLNLILQMLKVNQGKDEFSQNSIMDQFIHILSNTESEEIKITLLSIILYISEKQWQRARLQEKNCFSILMSIFSQAIVSNTTSLINASIVSLAHFSDDKPFRIFLANSHKTYQTYRVLFQCMDYNLGVPAPTRLAAAGIISRMIKTNDVGDVRNEMMAEGVMGPLINGLGDDEEIIQKECVIALTNLKECVDKYLDSFVKALPPLVKTLASQVPDLILKTLLCLQAIASNEGAIPYIVETGVVSILCRTFLQDVTSVPVSILEASGVLLIQLLNNPQAREIMIREKVFYALLPLYTYGHPDIERFWYDAMAEMCNFVQFRSQLEADMKSIGFIKQAIYNVNANYFKEITFIVRALVESKNLVGALVDDIVLSGLFANYERFLPEAEADYLVFMYQTVNKLAIVPSAHDSISKSLFILNFILLGIQKEETRVSNSAAAALISILENVQLDKRTLMHTLPLVEDVIMYARSNDRLAREQAGQLAQLIKQDPVFATKLNEANRAFLTPPETGYNTGYTIRR